MITPALSKESSGILLLPHSVHPSVRKKINVCHWNSVYILRMRQMILQDFIGHVLQMCNKVSKFSFCPLGSNRGRKMTFSRVILSLELNQHFKKLTNMIFQEMIGHVLQMRNKVSKFVFCPILGIKKGSKTTNLLSTLELSLEHLQHFKLYANSILRQNQACL